MVSVVEAPNPDVVCIPRLVRLPATGSVNDWPGLLRLVVPAALASATCPLPGLPALTLKSPLASSRALGLLVPTPTLPPVRLKALPAWAMVAGAVSAPPRARLCPVLVRPLPAATAAPLAVASCCQAPPT